MPADAATRPAPARAALAAAREIARDIKLAHSVFALPFALLAAFLARPEGGPAARFLAQLALVVACMVAARTWAMLVNRLADRRLDGANPRTAGRALPAGRLTTRAALAGAGLSAASFVALAALFGPLFANWWPAALALPALAWIALYSYTKRLTALCHVFLGGALAASPLCAAIAVEPASLASTPALWWLAGMVLCWVAGFDVIYALQDMEHDRAVGLASIPARLGPRGAAWVSRALHALAGACLLAAWLSDARLGAVFGAGVLLAIALLIAEHVVLVRRGLAGLDMAFFTLNGVVSCVLGASGVIDLLA